MQFANNENGQRTYIGEAEEAACYSCPYCGAPMIQRRGQINIPHFAHMKGYLCTDNWRYEEMSEWHRAWQSNYPLENQEIAVSNEFGRHRADVLINDTVVEFQHSPLSAEEFRERNEFYAACGYRVIWLFDAREAYLSNLTVDDRDASVYRWKHPPKTLTGLDLHGKVQVYFHLCDESQEENGVIIRLTWCSDGNLSQFKATTPFTETQFIEITKNRTEAAHTDEVSTIVNLARKHNAGVMIVRNERHGRDYKISLDADEMMEQYRKYGKIPGYYRKDFNDRWTECKEIFGPLKREWKWIWSVTKEEAQQYRDRFAQTR